MSQAALICGLLVNLLLVAAVIFHRLKYGKHLWPPPTKNAWQKQLVFWSLRIQVLCLVVIGLEEWGALAIPDSVRFTIALPVFIITFLLGSAGVIKLGLRNTYGEAHHFEEKGLYRYSRNPQYTFYAIAWLAFGFWMASAKAMVLLVLLAVWYLIAPFAEETWLSEKYGQKYTDYKKHVPRYLGLISKQGKS